MSKISYLVITLLLIFAFNLFAKTEKNLCENYTASQTYQKTLAGIDKKIEVFANKKTIATQADTMLSKLLTAKSPMINSWMQKRNLTDKSEEEIVKAWRLYFARTFILMKYPQLDKVINAETEKLVDDILKSNLTKNFQLKTDKLFAQAKKESLAATQAMNLPKEKKDKILERLKAIKLYWPKNLKSGRNNAIPLDLIEWGIAYDPVPNEINIGLRALAYPNDETYLIDLPSAS